MGRFLTAIFSAGFATAVLASGTAEAQSINPGAFGGLSADVERHKVQIYVDQIRAIQDSGSSPEQIQQQIQGNLYFTGMCSIEREILYSITGENALAGDAATIRAHFTLLSKAMERLNLANATQSESEFQALKSQNNSYLSGLYAAGSTGNDPDARQAMLNFSDTCRQVTLAVRSVDAMALARQQGR